MSRSWEWRIMIYFSTGKWNFSEKQVFFPNNSSCFALPHSYPNGISCFNTLLNDPFSLAHSKTTDSCVTPLMRQWMPLSQGVTMQNEISQCISPMTTHRYSTGYIHQEKSFKHRYSFRFRDSPYSIDQI